MNLKTRLAELGHTLPAGAAVEVEALVQVSA